jgi:hypothetical protein
MRIEDSHQISVIRYLRTKYPEVLFNISPANCINPWQGKKNKAMGLQAGCPDIMIFKANADGYAGLFIELKRPELRDFQGKVYQTKGTASKEQKAWIAALNKAGYYAQVCYGSDSAISLIDSYISGVRSEK